MKKPTRSKALKAIAIALMITAAIILVSEWRAGHNPTVIQGWPIDVHITNPGGGFIMQRNTYGRNLYYTNAHRVYRYEASEWTLVYTSHGNHVRLIRPNTIRGDWAEWNSLSKPEGQYRFARDYFLTSCATIVYKTLYAYFELLCWQAWSDQLRYYHLQGGVSPWREDYVAFVIAGASSRGIVPAGRVQVSRTAIAFTSRNRSLRYFSHGDVWELAHYVDGAWQPVPYTPSDTLRLSLGGGLGVIPRFWWLDMIQLHFMHGELPPGRYMFIRRHSRSLDDNEGRYFDYEYMMFEFVICENTPVYLPEHAGMRALASAILPGIVVRVGVFIAVAKLLGLIRRLLRTRAQTRHI
ncbi:MAG: hypothetical protein FWC73_11610 [Defluviitaleaceae bacterium]|nr:hypothetical protein [Defluviitaleaceae bacterium]